MESLLPLLPVLAVLACPLGMAAIGVGAWVIARARGEKKPLSMGCMSGQCKHEEHANQEGNLNEQVARLEQEVQVLRAQLGASGNGAPSAGYSAEVVSEQKRPGEVTGRAGEKQEHG